MSSPQEVLDHCDFLPDLTSPGGNLCYVGPRPLEELLSQALIRPECVAFTSNGYLKQSIKSRKELVSFETEFGRNQEASQGLYLLKERAPKAPTLKERVPKDEVPKVTLKLLCNWTGSSDLLEEFQVMLEPGERARSQFRSRSGQLYQLVTTGKADYYVIINFPRTHPGNSVAQEEDFYEPKRTVVIQMEPWCYNTDQRWGVRTWGQWSNPDPEKYLKVITTRTGLNLVQWFFDLSPSQLLNPDQPSVTMEDGSSASLSEIKRSASNTLASICGPKYFDPGHKLRVDFLKYLEQIGEEHPFKLDIYGFNNTHGFRNYCGQLSQKEKWKGYFPYKYYLMAENNREANYITEKLWEPILAECLCFYDGAPNVEDWIDPEAFIKVDLSNHSETLQTITKAIENDWWAERLPAIRRAKRKIIEELAFFPTISRAIEESPEPQEPREPVSKLEELPKRTELSSESRIKLGYQFYPGLDQMDCDLDHKSGNLTQILLESLDDPRVHAVNTLGYRKTQVVQMTSSPYFGPKDGLYVKVGQTKTNS